MFITPTTPSPLPSAVPQRRAWLGIGIIVLLLIVGLIVWLRQRGSDGGLPIVRPATSPQSRTETPKPIDPSLQPGAVPDFPVDTDDDGVSDATEAAKGTDPQNPDSDNDGFSDSEELFFRKTNPLQADPVRPYPGTGVDATAPAEL
jgi:hypothetical protein